MDHINDDHPKEYPRVEAGDAPRVPTRPQTNKKLLIGLCCGAAVLLGVILFMALGKDREKAAMTGEESPTGEVEALSSFAPMMSTLILDGAIPTATPAQFFPDGQAFSHPGIGVHGEVPKDFAITTDARSILLERGKGTVILISFGYNGEYTYYDLAEYKAHIRENLQRDLTSMGMDMDWEITGGADVRLGGSEAYRIDTRIADGTNIRLEAYAIAPQSGQGTYVVYVLQNITVPDAQAHERDNALILASLSVSGGENCGLTLVESANMPVKFAYDNAYCRGVEENPAKDGYVANIWLYPTDEERYPLLIELADDYAEDAEDVFAVFTDILQKDEDFEMGETKTKVWGERTYTTRTYQRRKDGVLLVGMVAVTEMEGHLYALDQNDTEEAAEEAIGFLVDVMSTFAPQ